MPKQYFPEQLLKFLLVIISMSDSMDYINIPYTVRRNRILCLKRFFN